MRRRYCLGVETFDALGHSEADDASGAGQSRQSATDAAKGILHVKILGSLAGD